jgi:adenylate cyclase
MPLLDDLKITTDKFFRENFEVNDTTIIPTTDYKKLTFGNKGVKTELTFLFIDIRKSSELHDNYGFVDAAKIYQSFHDINVRIINKRQGEVRAFDGDRIMGVFSGPSKNNNAVAAAMNIRYAIREVLNKKLPNNKPINIGIGIETGITLITKVGRGDDENNNDLVWIGKACNYASHMCNESTNQIYISPTVYSFLDGTNKKVNNNDIWKQVYMILKNGKRVLCYSTTYIWESL